MNDYLCYNLPSYIYHNNFCSVNANLRAFYQEKIDELFVLPGYFHVESVLSPLNTNPLRQAVIRFGLPNSCIPPEVLNDFRAEDEARRLDLAWQARVSNQIYLESFAYERGPFHNNPARFAVREVNGRIVLYDRTHSLTQPVYAPTFYYKP